MSGYGIYCFDEKTWAVFRGEPGTEDFQWWCGGRGWVCPFSDYWEFMPDCWAETYRTLKKAQQVMREVSEC